MYMYCMLKLVTLYENYSESCINVMHMCIQFCMCMSGFYMLKCTANNYNYVVAVGDICLHNAHKALEIAVGFPWWIDNFTNPWYSNSTTKSQWGELILLPETGIIAYVILSAQSAMFCWYKLLVQFCSIILVYSTFTHILIPTCLYIFKTSSPMLIQTLISWIE